MLEQLSQRQICFAVIVAQSSFKLAHLEFGGKDVFITIVESDLDKAQELTELELKVYGSIEKPKDQQKYLQQKAERFEKSETIPGLYEYEMTESEQEGFKSIQESQFNKIHHSKDGRIYELKSESFSDYFHTLHGDNQGEDW